MSIQFLFIAADAALMGGYLLGLIFFAWSHTNWRYSLASAITLVSTFCFNLMMIGYSLDTSAMIRAGEIIP